MLTCYDAAFARLLEQAGGGRAAGRRLGEPGAGGAGDDAQRHAGPDDLPRRRGAPRRAGARWCSWTCRSSPTRCRSTEAIRNAGRVLQETGAHGVKLEGGRPMAETVRALVDRGIPGDGPPRPHAPVGARARRLPGAGAGRRDRRAAAGRRRGARGGGRVRRRARAAAGRAGRADHRGAHHSHHRHRRRRGLRRAGAGAARHARPQRDVQSQVPQALRRAGRGGARRRPGLRRRGARRHATPGQSTASTDCSCLRVHDRARAPFPTCAAGCAPSARAGRRIALVPTMGSLHEGHLRLVDEARRRADARRHEHLRQPAPVRARARISTRYPRDLPRDRALAEARGVDALFVPTVAVMYPPGSRDPRGARADRGPVGGRGAARPLRRRADGRREAVPPGRARRRVLRAEGHPAGDAGAPDGARPGLAARDRRGADGARARRPGAQQPERLPRRRPAAAGGGAERRAPRRARRVRGGRAERGRAARRRAPRARDRADGARWSMSPSPSRDARAGGDGRTPTRWSRSPPGSDGRG